MGPIRGNIVFICVICAGRECLPGDLTCSGDVTMSSVTLSIPRWRSHFL